MSQTLHLDNPPEGFENLAVLRNYRAKDWILLPTGVATYIEYANHSVYPCIVLEKLDPREDAIQSAIAELSGELEELMDQCAHLMGSSPSCQVLANEEIERIRSRIISAYTSLLRK